MSKIMEIVAEETAGKSYHSFKYCYDSMKVSPVIYDDSNKNPTKSSASFETDNLKSYRDLREICEQTRNQPLFTFFMDGSRHVYKVDDIVYQNNVYPVVAGQVGVGCCEREAGRMRRYKFFRHLVLVLPKSYNSDCWNDEERLEEIRQRVNQCDTLVKLRKMSPLGIEIAKVLTYEDVETDKSKYEDRAIARVQDYMIEQEKRMVEELVKDKCLLQSQRYLMKDGSLEYKDMKSGNEDFRTLKKIQHHYCNVIGVSKSFNPINCLDLKGKHNSDYVAQLPQFCRTPVMRYENPDITRDVVFGVWYIRLRPIEYMTTPFDGVVKIEKILMDDELDHGADSDLVDLISANIINERNPTCYGSDKRWANHLYPIFLTESFIKSQYISPEVFLNLF